MQIRDDLTVIMVAPSAPAEVREEYKRGFACPPSSQCTPPSPPVGGLSWLGLRRRHRRRPRGMLDSSFVAEVKSDLMEADDSVRHVADRRRA
jgi:ketol-acid reductoisomerase